jgi:tetratricopeptide (TPR) repeat protein
MGMHVTRRSRTVATVVIAAFGFAAPALAQQGRASGTVRDQNGKAIRAAVVRADNPAGYPSQVTSTTDDKGRWAMIGLMSGEWRFTVEAPGYVTQSGSVQIRVATSPPIGFTLPRDPGPVPGALDRNIQQQIADANALRDQGRLDQAINAYQEIRLKNQKLTAVHFLLADAYRRKAAAERDPTAKRSLLELAITSYDELLKADASNDRARTELESARADVANTNQPTDSAR